MRGGLLGVLLALCAHRVVALERPSAVGDIAQLEQRLAAHPDQIEPMQDLAAALLAEVRIAPRSEVLSRAEALIDHLLAVHAPRADALDAWRLLIAHRFDQALLAARRAGANGADPLLALISEADALTELGRYDEAEVVVQRLLDQHYGIAALARASHLRRLFGDLPGAIELAEQALRASAAPVDRAWLALDLAELQLCAGAAPRALALATAAVADLSTPALVMQARAQRALGNPRAALALYRVAAMRVPRAETEVEILKLAHGLGDEALVVRTTRLLDGMARLDAQNGGGDGRSFIEFALLENRLAVAEDLARREWRQRPDVYSAAQLAWVLFRAGKRDEAVAYATRAIGVHTVDPLLEWRAGTVLAACGKAPGVALVKAALRRQAWLASDPLVLATRQ
jgi:tetratricopeptide (TPR) repeat protein